MSDKEIPIPVCKKIDSIQLQEIIKNSNISNIIPNYFRPDITIPKVPEFKSPINEKLDELIKESKNANKSLNNIDGNVAAISEKISRLIDINIEQSELSEEYQREIVSQLEQIRINTDEKEFSTKLIEEFKGALLNHGIGYALTLLFMGLQNLIFKI